MIAQNSIEPDSIGYESGKRLLEVPDEVALAAIGVNIVAGGYYEIEEGQDTPKRVFSFDRLKNLFRRR